MNLPKICRDENCLYLVQDLSGMSIYDKCKAIVNFCDKETKLFEKEIDRAIIDIFEKNGINIPNTDKSVLKLAFELLKQKNKEIEIVDLYENGKKDNENDNFIFIKKTKNHFVVMLEIEQVCGCKIETLQCGVEIKEKDL